MIDLSSFFTVAIGGANGALMHVTDNYAFNFFFTLGALVMGVEFAASLVVKVVARS